MMTHIAPLNPPNPPLERGARGDLGVALSISLLGVRFLACRLDEEVLY